MGSNSVSANNQLSIAYQNVARNSDLTPNLDLLVPHTDIYALCEPPSVNKINQITGFHFRLVISDPSPEKTFTALIVLNMSLQFKVLLKHTYVTAIQLSPSKLIVACFYHHVKSPACKDESIFALRKLARLAKSNPVILLGDANTHLLYLDGRSQLDTCMLDTKNRFGWVILNEPFVYTRQDLSSQTVIDWCMSSPEIAKFISLEVTPGRIISDHKLIICKFFPAGSMQLSNRVIAISKLTAMVKRHCLDPLQLLDKLVEFVPHCIRTSRRNNHFKWTQDLEDLKKKRCKIIIKCHKAARRGDMLTHAQLCEQAKKLNKSYRGKIEDARLRAQATFGASVSSLTVNRLLSSSIFVMPKPIDSLLVEGVELSDPAEMAAATLYAFFPEDDYPSDFTHWRLPVSPAGTPTRFQIDYHVRRQPNTSPGVDGLSNRHWKSIYLAVPALLESLLRFHYDTNTFPASQKLSHLFLLPKDPDAVPSPSNLRPIGLTSLYSRFWESLVREEVLFHLLHNDLLLPSQFGFLPNRSIEQALTIHQELLKSFPCWLTIKADLKSAYTLLQIEPLIATLVQLRLDSSLVNMLINYFLGRRAQVSFAGRTFSKPVFRGLTQGSPGAPLYFVTALNPCLSTFIASANARTERMMSANGVAYKFYVWNYADDILIHIYAKHFIRAPNLEASWALSELSCLLAPLGLSISAKKTIVFSPLNLLPIYLDGQEVQVVKEVTILGVKFSTAGHFEAHCKDLIKEAEDKLSRLFSREVRRPWLSLKLKRHLIISTIYSIFTPAAAVWFAPRCYFKLIVKLLRDFNCSITKSLFSFGFKAPSYPACVVLNGLLPIQWFLLRASLLRNFAIIGSYPPWDVKFPETRQFHLNLSPRSRFAINRVADLSADPNLPWLYDYSFYTDGSKKGTNVGSAFVMLSADGELLEKGSARLPPFATSFQSEAAALLLALRFILKNEKCAKKSIIFFTDSSSLLASLSSYKNDNELCVRCKECLLACRQINTSITFSKVVAHSNVDGNELADSLAAEAASGSSYFSEDIPLAYSALRSFLTKKIVLTANNEYKNCSGGATIKLFFPDVPSHPISPSSQAAFLLSGFGPHTAWMYQPHIDRLAVKCKCGAPLSSPHLFFSCQLTLSQVQSLMDKHQLPRESRRLDSPLMRSFVLKRAGKLLNLFTSTNKQHLSLFSSARRAKRTGNPLQPIEDTDDFPFETDFEFGDSQAAEALLSLADSL